MEIERKFLINKMPDRLDTYSFHTIEQGYICTDPVVRIRRQDENYILTCKGRGMLAREECNLPMSKEAYDHLKTKVEGNFIAKRRYLIPLENNLTIELDIFDPPFSPLVLAEVEFPDKESASSFVPPTWFGKDVTYDKRYHNSYLSSMKGKSNGKNTW